MGRYIIPQRASRFREIFMDCFIRLERHKNAANALRSNSALWHKLVNFARDMQSGYKEQDSGERLDAACMDPLMRYYFSTIHFTESEITTLMDFPGPTGERAEELFSRSKRIRAYSVRATRSFQRLFRCMEYLKVFSRKVRT